MRDEVPQIPESTSVIYAQRDPTEKDTNHPLTLWISKEYLPHRVFHGKGGKWTYIGKLYPEEKK